MLNNRELSFIPENLSNSLINDIGKAYLKKHDARNKNFICGFFDSALHSNHHAANLLTNYNSDADAYQKWKFLAGVYLKLVNNHGELARSIQQLFYSAFRDGIYPYNLVHPSSDRRDYHREGSLDYKEVSSFALDIMIDNYYVNVFKKEAAGFLPLPAKDNSIYRNPDGLSNDLIQRIGIDYLGRHNVEQGGIVSMFKKISHGNQPSAKMLKNYDQATDAHSKWLFLASVFATLNKSHGELSSQLLNLFENAFGETAYIYEKVKYYTRYGSGSTYYEYNPQMIARALKGIANQHYAKEYRHAIENKVTHDSTMTMTKR